MSSRASTAFPAQCLAFNTKLPDIQKIGPREEANRLRTTGDPDTIVIKPEFKQKW